MGLPTGTVTFLFTDIEGSTKLAQLYPDALPGLLARHREILSQAVQTHDGYAFQIVGDSFAVAFHSASDALNTALTAQRALQSEAWKPAPLKVRMGIHTGAAQLNEGNEYSSYATLAFTQRIMSAGHGGQILLSGATRDLVRDSLPADTELVNLGERRLKDLLRPEHLYQLNLSGLPTTFPPLKTLDSFPNNLPMQLTSFIGRETEIAELKQVLQAHRLVTLTGSGGTGKTRLSLQVAAELLVHTDHGVWFVELAPLTDPERIPSTILSAIGIQEQPGKTPLELLKEYLHDKQALIVLDNCEHLVSASSQVASALLQAAPNLKILASSREALGIQGEAAYPVPSLKLPDIKHLPVIAQLSRYEAVRLFIDRALLVAPHFVVDQDNAPSIVQVCHRLDGIPLAIELAAARVRVLSVDQIAKRLDDRFRLLTGGARTALPRQQTLRALVDWSHDLLTEKERLLLRRLAVFAGGWSLEAAEEVCVGPSDLPPDEILDLLSQLVNKSLVVVMAEGLPSGETQYPAGGPHRYRMLETIHQYAREKLLEAGGGELVRDRHLAYFDKLTEQAEPELYRSNQVFWLCQLDDELDNFRTALEWALATDVAAGLRIASTPWRFWQVRGHMREVGDWLRQLLESYPAADALRARSLAVYAFSVLYQGNVAETINLARQSLQLARALSDQPAEALSLSILGVCTVQHGNVEDGVPILHESLALYRLLEDKIGQAHVINWLAIHNNDLERAYALAKEGLELNRELGNLSGIAECLNTIARIALWVSDSSSPAPWLQEALSIAHQIGSHTIECEALTNLGTLAYWQGDYQRANIYYQEAIALTERTGNKFHNLWSQVFMAYATLRHGDLQKAQALFDRSVSNTHKAGLTIALIFTIEGLASLLVVQNQPERALGLFAWADAMRGHIGNHRPPIEQDAVEKDLAAIHSQLDSARFERFSAIGQTMTEEQAIDYALTGEYR